MILLHFGMHRAGVDRLLYADATQDWIALQGHAALRTVARLVRLHAEGHIGITEVFATVLAAKVEGLAVALSVSAFASSTVMPQMGSFVSCIWRSCFFDSLLIARTSSTTSRVPVIHQVHMPTLIQSSVWFIMSVALS
jgi:hypothetical protein